MTNPQANDDRAAARAAEYGKWIAVNPIDIAGARAFNPGDPVPVSHVDNGTVSRADVSGVNTKAAAAAAEKDGS